MSARGGEFFFRASLRDQYPEHLILCRGWDYSCHHKDGGKSLRLPSDLRLLAGDEDFGLYRSAMASKWWVLQYDECKSEWMGYEPYIEVNDYPHTRRVKNNREAIAVFEEQQQAMTETESEY